eukprot:12324338-Prorocentrum_lima.AAC.1
MTSSLVGSEMCIRDRHRGQRHVNRQCRYLRLRPGHEGIRPFGLSLLCPVSYTHLTLPTICSV